MAQAKLQVDATKPWDPYRAYEKRLYAAMSKERGEYTSSICQMSLSRTQQVLLKARNDLRKALSLPILSTLTRMKLRSKESLKVVRQKVGKCIRLLVLGLGGNPALPIDSPPKLRVMRVTMKTCLALYRHPRTHLV